jgi:TonB family protein
MNKLFFTIIFLCSTALFVNAQGTGQGNGSGSGSGSGMGDRSSAANKNSKNKALYITSKPRVAYTETARNSDVQGTVTLKVEFKKTGKIGKISVVSGLPYGLSEQAVKAAEKIEFQPAVKNGKPITVTKTVQYTFTLY